jgi:hypothetical protein
MVILLMRTLFLYVVFYSREEHKLQVLLFLLFFYSFLEKSSNVKKLREGSPSPNTVIAELTVFENKMCRKIFT